MYYLKSLFFNFLTVFFVDHIFPGLEVTSYTRLPQLGSDLIFAIILGGINSLIYPFFSLLKREISTVKIALIALLVNFGAYAVVKLFPIGIHVRSVEGYILASAVVALVSFLTNYFEMKRRSNPPLHLP